MNENKKKKVYFNTIFDEGGVLFIAKKKYGVDCSIRFAGRPKFILKEYIKRYGEKEGALRFKELLSIMGDCAKENFSPIVMYTCQENTN